MWLIILQIFTAVLTITLFYINIKSKLYRFISILLVLVVLISSVYQTYEPPKELEINIAKIYSLDEIPNWILLTDQILLFQGCNNRALMLVHNFDASEEIKDKKYLFMYSTAYRENCKNCTYYNVAIFNLGVDVVEPLTFIVALSNYFTLDEANSKLEITQQNNSPYENNFIITLIGGLKGKEMETVTFKGHTEHYDDLKFSCDAIKNSRCYTVKYDIGDINDQNAINSFFSDLNVPFPDYVENEMRAYNFNFEKYIFEDYPLDIEYIHFADGICKTQYPLQNPSLFTY